MVNRILRLRRRQIAGKRPRLHNRQWSPGGALSRTQIGISIANPNHRRLVEGVSAQLGLIPIFLEEADLAHPDRIAGVELLIADESRALRFRQAAGLPEDPREGMRLAVVAAIAVTDQRSDPAQSQSMASNVPEALKLISSNEYQVLLSDLHMPGAGDDFSVVLLSVMTIADEIDSQLSQAMSRYIEELQSDALPV